MLSDEEHIGIKAMIKDRRLNLCQLSGSLTTNMSLYPSYVFG